MASIAVVGGGLAGLVCAWRLQRAGHEVEVLDRAAVPGGRMRGERCGDSVIDTGVPLILGPSPNLESTAAAVGLSTELRPVVHPTTAVLRNWSFHGTHRPTFPALELPRLLSAGALAKLLRLTVELLRPERNASLSLPTASERALPFDDESAAHALRQLCGEEALRYLIGPALYAALDAQPEDLSWGVARAALPGALRALAGREPVRSIAGGNGRLPAALAERTRVRPGCEVVHVEPGTDGVRLVYAARGRESGVIADAVVLAVSSEEALRICPKLTPDERGFLESLEHAPAITAHLLLPRAPALPASRVVFPRAEGLEIDGLVLQHHKAGCAPAGAGLVTATFGATATARLWEAPDHEIAAFVSAELERTPLPELLPSETLVRRQPRRKVVAGPGSVRRLVRFRERVDRTPRMAFAGDFVAGPGAEAAVVAGMRAATEIVRTL